MRKLKHNPQEIFRSAETFRLSSNALITSFDRDGQQVVLPSIVCLAFACELYLKSLITLDNQEGYTPVHRLGDLFRQLQSDTQDEVKLFANDLSSAKREQIEKACQANDWPMPPVYDFDTALLKSQDAFVNMRYMFDSKPPDIFAWHASEILDAIRHVILIRRPEWSTLLHPAEPENASRRSGCPPQRDPELDGSQIFLRWQGILQLGHYPLAWCLPVQERS